MGELIQISVSNSVAALATRLLEDGSLERKFEESLAAIRAHPPLPSLSGTTDIYSVGQSALLANRLEWSPRPIFQSYVAYTPALQERNARYLEGAAGTGRAITC
jgi:hypothetical protein